MKKGLKALLLVMCAIVLVVATVFTTLAFLQDTTQTITNTFTVGNVGIDLLEAKVDSYGEYLDASGKSSTTPYYQTETGNSFRVVPGESYKKDAIVRVEADSEKSYVFVKVDNKLPEGINLEVDDEWKSLTEDENNTVYYRIVENDATNVQDLQIFEFDESGYSVTVESNFITESLITEGASVNNLVEITAYAIQVEGIVEIDSKTEIQVAWDTVFAVQDT